MSRLSRCSHPDRPAARAVVADDGGGAAPPSDKGVELARHAEAADRCVDHERQRLAGEVVDDAEDAEGSPPGQGVGDEVQSPALVGPVRRGHGRPRTCGALAASPATHRQALLAVEAMELLLVHAHAFAFEQHTQPAVAKAPAIGRQALGPGAPSWDRHRPARRRAVGSSRAPPSGDAQLADALRANSVFDRRSFEAATSSIDSASNFLNRRFSSSSVFSFCASDVVMPPYFAFEQQDVCWLIPCLRQNSSVLPPAPAHSARL